MPCVATKCLHGNYLVDKKIYKLKIINVCIQLFYLCSVIIITLSLLLLVICVILNKTCVYICMLNLTQGGGDVVRVNQKVSHV